MIQWLSLIFHRGRTWLVEGYPYLPRRSVIFGYLLPFRGFGSGEACVISFLARTHHIMPCHAHSTHQPTANTSASANHNTHFKKQRRAREERGKRDTSRAFLGYRHHEKQSLVQKKKKHLTFLNKQKWQITASSGQKQYLHKVCESHYHLTENDYSYGSFVLELIKTVIFVI